MDKTKYELIDETLADLVGRKPYGGQLRFDYHEPNKNYAISDMIKYDLVDFKIPDKPFQSVTHITENGENAIVTGSQKWIEDFEIKKRDKYRPIINTGQMFGDNTSINHSNVLNNPIEHTTINKIPKTINRIERTYWIVGIVVSIATVIIAYLALVKK